MWHCVVQLLVGIIEGFGKTTSLPNHFASRGLIVDSSIGKKTDGGSCTCMCIKAYPG